MKKIILAAILSLGSFSAWAAKAPSAAHQREQKICESFMLFKEARGENIITQRLVLDVLENRKQKLHLNSCQVLQQQGQYPYAKQGIKVMSKQWEATFTKVKRLPRTLGTNYLYFNHKKHKWGKNTIKIGGLYFSE